MASYVVNSVVSVFRHFIYTYISVSCIENVTKPLQLKSLITSFYIRFNIYVE
jgi:hypothetical protein